MTLSGDIICTYPQVRLCTQAPRWLSFPSAGLRVVVEAHGGHFWSTQGSVQRPLDVTSLRIDAAERMGLQLGDALISPTHYMTAFLRERAWRLPKASIVIPNVLPAQEAGQDIPQVVHLVRLPYIRVPPLTKSYSLSTTPCPA